MFDEFLIIAHDLFWFYVESWFLFQKSFSVIVTEFDRISEETKDHGLTITELFSVSSVCLLSSHFFPLI